jgi:hypothetical protein
MSDHYLLLLLSSPLALGHATTMSLEFPSIGQVCSLPECGECDFLPFQCSRCSGWYCHLHLNGHACSAAALTEGRTVGGEAGVPLEESEAFLADQKRMAQNSCDHCHQYNRYLVNCLQPGCKGKRYCVEHRDHYEHAAISQTPDGGESKPKVRIQSQVSATAAVGTRASLPAPLGRMRGSSGVLIALVLGGPVPFHTSTSTSSDHTAFHCQIESLEGDQCHRIGLQLVSSAIEHVPLHRLAKAVHSSLASTGTEPAMQMQYFLCFARILSLGSSLGNLLEMIHYAGPVEQGDRERRKVETVGESATQPLDAKRVQIGVVYEQKGAVIHPGASTLCQDTLLDRSLLILTVDGAPLTDTDWSNLSARCSAFLGGFLKPATAGKPRLPQAPELPVIESQSQQLTTEPPSLPTTTLAVGLRFPPWTDIPMKNTKGTPRGADFVKGVPPAQKVLIGVVSFIPLTLPPKAATDGKTGELPLLKLPAGFCLLVNQSWSKGKLLDRVADEFRDGIYGVEEAADALCKFNSSPKQGLELYQLSSCRPLDQCTELKQGDVLALFLKGGLPEQVVAEWRALLPQGDGSKPTPEGATNLLEAKNLPKELRLRHMKDCVIC